MKKYPGTHDQKPKRRNTAGKDRIIAKLRRTIMENGSALLSVIAEPQTAPEALLAVLRIIQERLEVLSKVDACEGWVGVADELANIAIDSARILTELGDVVRRGIVLLQRVDRMLHQPKRKRAAAEPKKESVSARIVAFMKTRPGELHSKKELCEALQLTPGEAAGALRRLNLAGRIETRRPFAPAHRSERKPGPRGTAWCLAPESLPLPFSKPNGLKLVAKEGGA